MSRHVRYWIWTFSASLLMVHVAIWMSEVSEGYPLVVCLECDDSPLITWFCISMAWITLTGILSDATCSFRARRFVYSTFCMVLFHGFVLSVEKWSRYQECESVLASFSPVFGYLSWFDALIFPILWFCCVGVSLRLEHVFDA